MTQKLTDKLDVRELRNLEATAVFEGFNDRLTVLELTSEIRKAYNNGIRNIVLDLSNISISNKFRYANAIESMTENCSINSAYCGLQNAEIDIRMPVKQVFEKSYKSQSAALQSFMK